LVLLIDTTTGDFGERDGERVRQRIEGLSRALDVTGSRYVVTAVLAGAVLMGGIEALSETCRVLSVEDVALDEQGKPVDEIAERQLDDRVRVLLPLTLPAPLAETQDESGPAIEQLIRVLPAETNLTLVHALIDASSAGEQAVTDAMAEAIDGALNTEPEEEQS